MIQAFTKNVVVAANTAIPLNNVSIRKGCSATTSGASAISLNKKGVYMVSVDAVATANVAGAIQLQLTNNGIAVPQAVTAETAANITDTHALSFTTLVQVSRDNCNCDCSSSSTVINVVNNGVPSTYAQFNIVVTKIC